MKRSHKKRLFGAAALAGAAFLGTCIWALQSTLGVSQYEVALPQGMEGLDGYRIVQIADLHSAKLDQELEQALEQLQPHLIVMTGDLVNREDRDFSQALATAALAVRFAPTYFVRGNHEVDNPDYAILRRGLEEAGVTILEDKGVVLEYHGASLNLVGVKDVTAYSGSRTEAIRAMGQTASEQFVDGAYHVLLSHRPSLLETYGACGADLVFSGHAHGGQVRLPVLGAVFAPDQGLWPQVTAGVHTAGRPRWWSAGDWATEPLSRVCGTVRSWWRLPCARRRVYLRMVDRLMPLGHNNRVKTCYNWAKTEKEGTI